MEGSFALGPAERKRLLEMYRSDADPAMRQRAHMIWLLADGWSWLDVASVMYCSRRTIARWKARYETGDIDTLAGRPRSRLVPGADGVMVDALLL